MRVALFVPCYVDQLYPEVGFATLRVLRAHGVEPEVLAEPACCGQPLINTGAVRAARPLARAFDVAARDFDAVVAPSGSCVALLRSNVERYALSTGDSDSGAKVYELTQFLVERLGVTAVEASFPHRVGLLQSCHALRGLGLGSCSERPHGVPQTASPAWSGHALSPALQLLRSVVDIELVEAARSDECCGFGGSFSLVEPDVSAKMGLDTLRDWQRAGAKIITSTDVSCLMHLGGLAARHGLPLRTLHVSQILEGQP